MSFCKTKCDKTHTHIPLNVKIVLMSFFQVQKNKRYMTVFDGGRLGNLMSQYASLYAYARLLKNTTNPVLSHKMHTELKTKIFPHISIKTYNSEKCDKFFNWEDVNIQSRELDNAQPNDEAVNSNLEGIYRPR